MQIFFSVYANRNKVLPVWEKLDRETMETRVVLLFSGKSFFFVVIHLNNKKFAVSCDNKFCCRRDSDANKQRESL